LSLLGNIAKDMETGFQDMTAANGLIAGMKKA
jgi:hypothetical protein